MSCAFPQVNVPSGMTERIGQRIATRPAGSQRGGRQQYRKSLMRIEEMRASLPIGQYLALLDQAIMTGTLPRFELDGSFQGQYDKIGAKQRLEVLQKTVDKVIPNTYTPPEALPHDLPDDLEIEQELNDDPEAIREVNPDRLLDMRAALLRAQDQGVGSSPVQTPYDLDSMDDYPTLHTSSPPPEAEAENDD